MARDRFIPRTQPTGPTAPFVNAEEAWFWFVRCQRARDEGARFHAVPGAAGRPCDPDDVFRAVDALRRRRRISREQLGVLGAYGLLERPPDPRQRGEERPARLWDAALDRLSTVLRQKGIVE